MLCAGCISNYCEFHSQVLKSVDNFIIVFVCVDWEYCILCCVKTEFNNCLQVLVLNEITQTKWSSGDSDVLIHLSQYNNL